MKCPWIDASGSACASETGGHRFCINHAEEFCVGCGHQATRSCDGDGGTMRFCGESVCFFCGHDGDNQSHYPLTCLKCGAVVTMAESWPPAQPPSASSQEAEGPLGASVRPG